MPRSMSQNLLGVVRDVNRASTGGSVPGSRHGSPDVADHVTANNDIDCESNALCVRICRE